MTWLRQIPGVREIEFDGETLPRTSDLIIGTGLAASYDPATRKTTLATNASGLPAGTATYQPLTWNGSAWVGAALNLAQAAAVTGVLGVANGGVPVPANPADDAKVLTASGGTYTWTVAPTGLPALGAANTVLRVNAGGVAVEYAKLTTANLDAAAGIVGTQLAAGANILGSQLSAAAGIVGTQLSATAAIAATQLAAGAAGTVLIGGASNSFSATPIVTSLTAGATAAAGAVLAAAALTFGIDVSAPNITHTAAANGQTPTDLVIQAQSAHASSGGAARKGADLLLKPGTTTSGGTASRVRMWSGYTGGGTAEIFNFYYDSPTSTAVLTTSSGSIAIQPPASASTYIRAGTASGDIVLDTMQTTGNVRIRTGPAADPVFLANNKNATFFAATGSYGGGVNVIFGGSVTTTPTTAPAGGGLIYWDGDGNMWGVNEAGVHTQLTP